MSGMELSTLSGRRLFSMLDLSIPETTKLRLRTKPIICWSCGDEVNQKIDGLSCAIKHICRICAKNH